MASESRLPEGATQGGQPKKPFEPPRLTVYGDINALTMKVGRTGLADGGKFATSKTRP